MADLQLPAELQQLERDLVNRLLPTASAGLRQKVLDGVRSQLRAARSRARWQFAAAVAAVSLLWMNLSMSATQATDFGLRSSESAYSTVSERQALQSFLLEEDRRERSR